MSGGIDWQVSYEMVRNAIIEHLGQFVFEDDVAEEAILIDTISKLGYLLRNVHRDDEAMWQGAVDLVDIDKAAEGRS